MANYMYIAFHEFGLDMPEILGDQVVDFPILFRTYREKFEFLTVNLSNGLQAQHTE